MDKISAKVRQVAAPAIAPSLTEIFSMSIDLDQFHSERKVAKVIPLFKRCQRPLLDNFWPISILPLVSKLMERILYDQMFEYLIPGEFWQNINLAIDLIILQLLHYWIRTNGMQTLTAGFIT